MNVKPCNCRCNFNYLPQAPSSENNRHSESQEIPWPLWNPKFNSCVRKSPLSIKALSQTKSVHTLKPDFCNIHFKIIFIGLIYDNFSIADYIRSNNLILHSNIHLSEILFTRLNISVKVKKKKKKLYCNRP